eukprot:gnl/MRDRNA2_/MRDRNA2_206199_c0_seq1.p1 gnl/MRDRNA2_/MRDRNA2_206199_c0~~gnl/MRDRNA2_/MRDRNA2_206199_c0_seq1.p1  ORF type:complete len:316 (+),score=62.18 gnl/MRDRNA2_/MRDRNA2_206199_c0_seq1:52-948(+)
MAKPSHVVVDAATVLCIRGSCTPARKLTATDYVGDRALNQDARTQLGEFSWEFKSGIQLLMGQSEVVNWVRSKSLHELNFMRYGGEYKFAGGTNDSGESLEETARRELSEEFGVTIPSDAILRPFRVNATRVVQGKSFIMHNFVCIAEENPWLANLDLDTVNAALQHKRDAFQQLIASSDSKFWSMNKHEREKVSPEVRRIDWLNIADAVDMMLVSKCEKLAPVNAFQQKEFGKYGIKKRDPMFASMHTIQAIESCGSIEAVRDSAKEFEESAALRSREQAATQIFGSRVAPKAKAKL